MTTAEIVTILHQRYKYAYSKKQIKFLVDKIFDIIIEGLVTDGVVALRELATLRVVKHKRYKTKRVKFKSSAKLVASIRYKKTKEDTLPTK